MCQSQCCICFACVAGIIQIILLIENAFVLLDSLILHGITPHTSWLCWLYYPTFEYLDTFFNLPKYENKHFKIGVNPSKSFLKSILRGKMLIYIYECIFIVNHFRFVIDKAYISKILSYASIENEDDGTCLNSGTQKVKELLYILAPRKS